MFGDYSGPGASPENRKETRISKRTKWRKPPPDNCSQLPFAHFTNQSGPFALRPYDGRLSRTVLNQGRQRKFHIYCNRYEYFFKLSMLPRNSSKTRVRNRCIFTRRPRSVYKLFRISRIVFRKYFILGAFSFGILLFGCSMIFGFTGVLSSPNGFPFGFPT
ncbi:small subunit ribosomal protein S14 [Marchantia polymorpha subsp. ruderalis]|nr:hypothetical protein Mp_8g15340 [Marchantia polymorpha subsp. ruderalis]